MFQAQAIRAEARPATAHMLGYRRGPGCAAWPRPCCPRPAAFFADAPDPTAAPDTAAAVLDAACDFVHARVGVGASGRRGLVATRNVPGGGVVLPVPVSNALVILEGLEWSDPRNRAVVAHRQAEWRRAHGVKLPRRLSTLLAGSGDEEMMVAWLLWLIQRRQARAPGATSSAAVAAAAAKSTSGSCSIGGGDTDIWDLYVDSLPRPHEMSTGFNFTPDEADRWLALPAWKVRIALPGGQLMRAERGG